MSFSRSLGRLTTAAGAMIAVRETPTGARPLPATSTDHHPTSSRKSYTNPWPSFHDIGGFLGSGRAIISEWKSKPLPPKDEWVKVIKPTWGLTEQDTAATFGKDIKATWMGHACFLVELPANANEIDTSQETNKLDLPARGTRILFDPVFSHRCSPSQVIGPARLTKAPVELSKLPHVDLVVISHAHYDHLDITTVQSIYARQPKGSVHFFAPLGNKAWFVNNGFKPEHVTELDWWQRRDIALGSDKSTSKESDCTLTCLPAQHFAGRTPFDKNKTLWSSWAVEAAGKKVYFGGDTGLRYVPLGGDETEQPQCPAFAQIGDTFGGFDLAFIPVGAFSPRTAFSSVHASPNDAVIIHKHIKSKRSIAMHWGCWALGDEIFSKDEERVAKACRDAGLDEKVFNTLNIGETLRI
ncbi:uncharacterized protein L969DRAFT_51286 [Mixia osmundae IAM 14324]|uniref:Metallo-beta-lactamase domain-containing protein n=1 Tax=Mixia osmundae (strain CBS 9802 / IAM 14324 / JCM 22182 / KY 12970) TaxID=764103 RepID=G7DZ09_MIXOS|nr:uncharacterized protein L969DRAFT_51286 [Mixia osmundae IAM 14324]KEI38221.1 hypothetical protein L969DRAFT_51286 [Mixia osmundae IAM 14324]GAA95819.1 hypothetical protein E5Q_02476 [Mixia osmundae IAM 14324]